MAKTAPNPFIAKLWALLQQPENWAYIKWNADGDGIEIVQPDGLMVNVLPKYFRQGKLCSFVRQLNLYGFEKQKDKWEFKHQEGLFKRGASQNLVYIARRAQNKKRRSSIDDEEHLEELTPHVDKKRELVPLTPSLDSVDHSVVQHVPAESLQTYEERQSTQEAAIHFLMEAMHQQKQEMTMMRNQMTMMSQYILANGIANSTQQNLLSNAPSQPFGQIVPSQPLQRVAALPYSQNPNPPQAHRSPPLQQTKEEAFRRHQAWGHPGAAARNGQRPGPDYHSPSTDSDNSLKASPRSSVTATPVFSPNSLESINSEFNTVTLDEPNFNVFGNDQPQLADDQMIWM